MIIRKLEKKNLDLKYIDRGKAQYILLWVGIGIHVVEQRWRWNLLTICPYCQYDSMVYYQALLTEALQVLYINSHPTAIYIHFLQVDFLEEVNLARF